MFKRNQVEEAIFRSGPADRDERFDVEAKIRLKRLLDSDRKRPVTPKRLFDRTFAFYGEQPGGTGQDVLYSAYEAFALWLGLKLLESGYPQGRVVFLLRHYREALEREYNRIISKDLAALFEKSDWKPVTDAQKDTLLREGRLVDKVDNMIFLAVRLETETFGVTTRFFSEVPDRRPTLICRGSGELTPVIEGAAAMRVPMLVIELTNPAHQLAYWLARVEPTRRGRR